MSKWKGKIEIDIREGVDGMLIDSSAEGDVRSLFSALVILTWITGWEAGLNRPEIQSLFEVAEGPARAKFLKEKFANVHWSGIHGRLP